MSKLSSVLGVSFILAFTTAHADSFLRIKCDDKDVGAAVFINGKLVGNCPVDAPAPAGLVQLRAHKVDGDYEQIFEKQIRVIEGVPQRIEVVLSSPQLTAAAIRRNEADETSRQLRMAESGDINAMKEISKRYAQGVGIAKNDKQSLMWSQRAVAAEQAKEISDTKAILQSAERGTISAMFEIATRYESGRGITQNTEQANFWRNKANMAQQEQQTKLAQVQKEKKLRDFSFIPITKEVLDPNNPKHRENPSSCTLAYTYSPMWLASDLSTAPTNTTKYQEIQNQAALRPSTWGKPDSMIAKASISKFNVSNDRMLMQ